MLAFASLGREFIPTLDEGDVLAKALRIPSTSLEQSQAMQVRVETTLTAIPKVADVLTRTGTAEIASDPMPPNISDTFVMLKSCETWPDPSLPKADLVKRMEAALAGLLGNSYEFTQPIQMRFNELIAGVKSDVAVKVYGDEFDDMQAVGERVASELRSIAGAADVCVEQAIQQRRAEGFSRKTRRSTGQATAFAPC